MKLERQYRLLIRAFPSKWRQEHGDDMISTLLDGSKAEQRQVSLADLTDVLFQGVRFRLRKAGPILQILAAAIVLVLTTTLVHVTINPTPVSFILTAFVVVLIPGTGVIYSVSTAISSGWRQGSAAAFGCALGVVPHLLAAAIGLSGVMQAGANAFEVVRWVGVGYLAYLGIGMIRSKGSFADASERRIHVSAWRTIRRGVLLNLLNPKLTVFFFAFLPQFLSSPPNLLDIRLMGLSTVFMAMSLAVFLVYAAFASAARERVLSSPTMLRRIEQLLGITLFGFAARLAVADR